MNRHEHEHEHGHAYIGNKLMDISVPVYSLSQSTINRHDLRKFYQHEY